MKGLAGNPGFTLWGLGEQIFRVDEQPLRKLDRVVVQLDKTAIPVRILGWRNLDQVAAVVRKHPDAKEVPLAAIREAKVHPDSAEWFPLGCHARHWVPGHVQARSSTEGPPADKGWTLRGGIPRQNKGPDPLPRHDAVAAERLGDMPVEIGAAPEPAIG